MTTLFFIIIVFHVLALGMTMESHGKPKEGKHNAWSSFWALLIILGLVYWHSVTLRPDLFK